MKPIPIHRMVAGTLYLLLNFLVFPSNHLIWNVWSLVAIVVFMFYELIFPSVQRVKLRALRLSYVVALLLAIYVSIAWVYGLIVVSLLSIVVRFITAIAKGMTSNTELIQTIGAFSFTALFVATITVIQLIKNHKEKHKRVKA